MCALFLSGPFRRVGWFRRSVCSPPPPALFLAVGPSCVRFFLPLAFQGFPGSAGCVCVCNIWIDVKLPSFSFFFPSSPFLNNAGGSSTIASLLPTKTLAIGGDTRPDQSGVPATFHCDGKGLSQVPQLHHYFHVYTVAAYSILFDDDSGHGDHSEELPLFAGYVVD